jgi:hypothetical protein
LRVLRLSQAVEGRILCRRSLEWCSSPVVGLCAQKTSWLRVAGLR